MMKDFLLFAQNFPSHIVIIRNLFIRFRCHRHWLETNERLIIYYLKSMNEKKIYWALYIWRFVSSIILFDLFLFYAVVFFKLLIWLLGLFPLEINLQVASDLFDLILLIFYTLVQLKLHNNCKAQLYNTVDMKRYKLVWIQ